MLSRIVAGQECRLGFMRRCSRLLNFGDLYLGRHCWIYLLCILLPNYIEIDDIQSLFPKTYVISLLIYCRLSTFQYSLYPEHNFHISGYCEGDHFSRTKTLEPKPGSVYQQNAQDQPFEQSHTARTSSQSQSSPSPHSP